MSSSPTIDQEEILQAIEVFLQYQASLSTPYLQKKSLQDTSSNTTIQDQLREACIYIGDKEEFSREIVKKTLDVLGHVRVAIVGKAERITGLEGRVEQVEEEMHRLQLRLKGAQEGNEGHEATIEALKKRVGELERSLEDNQKSFNKERMNVREEIGAFSELTEESSKKQRGLVIQNNRLQLEIREYRQEIEELKSRLAQHEDQLYNINSHLSTNNSRIKLLESQKQILESKVNEGEQAIQHLEDQIKEKDKEKEGHSQGSSKRKFSIKDDFADVSLHSMGVDVRNLNDELKHNDIIFQQEDVFTYTNELIEQQNSIHYLGETKDKPSSKDKEKEREKEKQKESKRDPPQQKRCNNQETINRMMIDPYYAHFILTSQSVKIRLDHDEFLGIDFQRYYNEVMDGGIQMHNWPIWIESKLMELNLVNTH